MSEIAQMPPDDDFLAAEYALGLAEGDALSAAQGRVRRDASFAAMVAGWQERFVAMTDAIAPVKPHRRVKKAILKELFPKQRVPLMQRLWVWQGIALAAVFFAAYITFPTLRPAPEVPGTVYATQLSGDSTLQMLAVYDTSRGDIALRTLAGGAPEGRVLELWAILPEAAPVSLGVLPEGDVTRVVMPDALAARAGQITFAISEEPPGGAPEGTPTGSVLAVGTVAEL